MKVRSFFLFFFFFIAVVLEANSSLLTSSDVRKVMGQLLEYHVEEKEMNVQLLERSLKIYINNFDPSYGYLLMEEVYPFIQANPQFLHVVLHDYQLNRFPTFFALNATIQKSIHRAREWRAQWEKNPKKIIADAKLVDFDKEVEKDFCRTQAELYDRHYQRVLKVVAYQMRELGSAAYEGKEAKLISLCEKQIALSENDYLGLNDLGYSVSQAKQEHLVILRTIKAMAHSLDAHTAYYSPEEAYAIKVQLEKGMCGIGVVLREGMEGICVHDVVKGGPAARSGAILAGDSIVEIDGNKVEGISFQHVLEIMRGKEGSKIILGIKRAKSGAHHVEQVELVRAKITLEDSRVDVKAEPFGDGYIGRITLHSFYEGEDGVTSEKDLRNAISELRQKGPLYGVVLDMRENSGGFLTQAVKVSGLFISCGVVVISKYSDGSIKYYRSVEGSRFYDGPLVVLVSRGSASAAEIVAQTLKDYGVAVLVGDDQTYGKGTIQHQTLTSDKALSHFKVTIGRYYTVSGQSTQIEGVKADIRVPTPYQYEKMGESFLEFPLPSDQVAPAFDDHLTDLDPFARKWFQRYYKPILQVREEKWRKMLPVLIENSKKRLNDNRNFQIFLKQIKKEVKPIKTLEYGSNDLQMEESVNIIKDMIFIQNQTIEN